MLKSPTFSFSIFKLTTVAIIFYCGNMISQVQGDSVHIESTYAKKFTGTISKVDKEGYFIKTSHNREIFLSKLEIKSIQIVTKVVETEPIAKPTPPFIDSAQINPKINNLEQKTSKTELLKEYKNYDKQNNTSHEIDGKSNFATVYFSRPFRSYFNRKTVLYHNEKTIGFLTGYRYIEYKCLPGEHVFWQKSGLFRKSYIRANLQENKVYFIECSHNRAIPIYGKSTRLKKHLKFIQKNNPKLNIEVHKDKLDKIYSQSKRRGVEKYKKLLENDGIGMYSLSDNMYFDSSAHDYPFMKKDFIKNFNSEERFNVLIGAWTGTNQIQSSIGGYNHRVNLNSMNPLGINTELRLKNKQNRPFMGVELSSFWYNRQLSDYWYLGGGGAGANAVFYSQSIILNLKVYYEFRRAIIFYGFGLGSSKEELIFPYSTSASVGNNYLMVGNTLGSYFWLNKMFQFHFEIKTFSGVSNNTFGYNFSNQFGFNLGLKYLFKSL